jgi:Domain of unknown function (DUF5134)
MSGPSWLTGSFAAVMILTAAYSASRLAVSRLRGRATEFDADALHAVMGAAMAGMLVPRLNVLPDSAWLVIFGMGAAWFGWHAVRAQGLRASGHSPGRFPVPHLIECVAMLYMLLPLHGSPPTHGETGMAMAGMGASVGPSVTFPALAVVLALFMVGYIVWTTDRLASLARARAIPSQARTGAPPPTAGGAAGAPAVAGVQHGNQAARATLAPTLAACGKLAMSITMGYMLILML